MTDPDALDPAIGNTRLVHASRLGVVLGFPRLLLKLERDNPTGSHKDRASREIVREALAAGFSGLTIGSCGNFGVSLARLSERVGLECRVFVPRRYHGDRVPRIQAYGARVERSEGGYEDAVEASRACAAALGLYDANPPGPGGEASIRGYGAIAHEIVDGLTVAPASVWVCAGNGTTLAGIADGFARRAIRPRLGIAGSTGNTAVTASVAAGRVVELDPGSMNESVVNEPLLNWRSYHADRALRAVRESGGWSHDAGDAEMLEAAELVQDHEGVAVLPAAASALVGLSRCVTDIAARRAPHVVVLTG